MKLKISQQYIFTLSILDAWNWVMDWSDMISIGSMTLILDKFFFPRWLQTLAMWLNHNPDYAQVTEWYSGWKGMISKELLTQPSIKGISNIYFYSNLSEISLISFT